MFEYYLWLLAICMTVLWPADHFIPKASGFFPLNEMSERISAIISTAGAILLVSLLINKGH